MARLVLAQAFRGLFYAPNYVALGCGYFASEGLDITITCTDPPDALVDSLFLGKVNIITSGLARLYERADDDWQRQVVCIGQVTARNFFFLVSRGASAAFRLEDLVGREVLVFPGSPTPWLCLRYLLSAHGVDPAEVRTVRYSTVDQAVGRFLEGEGDYIEVPEPYVDQLLARDAVRVAASVGKLLGPMPFSVYLVGRSTVNSGESLLRGFLRAIARAQKFLRRTPPEVVATVLTPYFPEFEVGTIARAVARYQRLDTWGHSPVISRTEFDRLTRILAAEQVTFMKLFDKLVDMRFIPLQV